MTGPSKEELMAKAETAIEEALSGFSTDEHGDYVALQAARIHSIAAAAAVSALFDSIPEPTAYPSISDGLVWATLEPFLETAIDLDLNVYEDNQSFGRMVAEVGQALRTGDLDSIDPTVAVSKRSSRSKAELESDEAPSITEQIRKLPWFEKAVEKSKEVISKLPESSLPSSLQGRGLGHDSRTATEYSAPVELRVVSPEPEIEWEYATADLNGKLMTQLDVFSYSGPTMRMRRRAAGPWEPAGNAESE